MSESQTLINLETEAKETIKTPPKQKMSYEEYLTWVDEDIRAEWVEGEVIIDMPPLHPHQNLIGFLDRLLGLYIAILDLGRLQVAPFELKLRPEGNAREPDLMFIAKAHLDRLTNERVIGPPDLIIEVISKDSIHRDQVDKFREYEAGGVPEYWIIDNRPGHGRGQFYQLDAQGVYQAVAVGADGIYRSTVLAGFWLRTRWLWAEQPNVLRAIAEVIGPERMAQALRGALDEAEDEKP